MSEVNFLGRLSHPNLVKLLGYCLEDKELLLVYEFIQKGSLENHLFRNESNNFLIPFKVQDLNGKLKKVVKPKVGNPTYGFDFVQGGSTFQPLAWNMRLKIALGAARGLAFLHTSEKTTMYRDFTASNILLDGNYNPKLSDFGLAKNGPLGSASHVTTRVMGTYGYAAPKYIATGHLYVKSDVFGFGVVLLEMLSGQRAVDKNRPSGLHNLVDWLKPSLADRRKLKTIMDPRLEGQYPPKAAVQAADLTLKCLGDEPRVRPSMKEVVEALERIVAIRVRPKESRPGATRSAGHRHVQHHHCSPINPMHEGTGTSQNSGSELKKMIKKSRSIKRSDPVTSTKRRNKPQSTNKSPPTDVPVAAPVSTPKKLNPVKLPETSPMRSTPIKLRDASPNHMKPTPVKLPDTSPNYMKSTTSSSNARKERSQVSPLSLKTSSVSKSPCLKDSKYPKQACDSGQKPFKTLTKKSSLKPVRTLTKSSSNKAGRPSSSMKKKSGVAVYPDPNVERATCSSTLKDSKFPPYVTLHPGGTESEGTSVMKVCPYTYCSLNGHHHAQLPPLKHFLRARRRSIKNQKSMKIKNQSPVRAKFRNERKEGINTGQLLLNGDPPAVFETEVEDYFVEIYAQPRQDTDDADGAIDETDDGRNAENLTDDSLHSVISIDNNSNHYSDFMMIEMDVSMIYTEQGSLQEDDADIGGYAIGSESKPLSPAESEADEPLIEDMDMDWEDGLIVQPDVVYAELVEKPSEDVKPTAPYEERNGNPAEHPLEELTAPPGESYGVSESEINFIQDENMACSIDVQWGTQMEERDNYSSPEDETEEDDIIYPEDPDVTAKAECDDELQLKGEHADNEDGAEEGTEANEDQSEGNGLDISTSTYSEGDSDSEWNKSKSGEASNTGDDNIHLKHIEADTTETCIATTDVAGAEEEITITDAQFNSDQDISENQDNQYQRTRCNRPVDDVEEPREFNPRGPNFLPVEPDEEAEKVDLRHQMMDERKNAEEWMLDYALQQTVNKLAPARKKRVSLLVEAFEAVIPVPKYKSLQRTASSFTQPRFLQACS